MKRRITLSVLTITTLALIFPGQAAFAGGPVIVTCNPSQDNSIFAINTGNSNGAGGFLFVGVGGFTPVPARALIQFDIANCGAGIPAGSTITGATLDLDLVRDASIVGPNPADHDLHAVTTAWGEGASDTGNPPMNGGGTVAVPPDATWLNAMVPAPTWGTAGGDFNPVASATALQVGAAGLVVYQWTGGTMVANVQNWLDNPTTNNGWILKQANENTPTASNKEFASRENPGIPSNPAGAAPVLTVTFDPPTQPFCGDGIVNQPSEMCDDLNLPTPTCDINCQDIIVVPPFCGDGIVNQPSEMCDDLNLPTPTCDINCQDIIVPECLVDLDCDDGQFCTLDSCVNEQCVFVQNPDPSCQRVGGEFIGVDSTALLLAGFQANALWLLPLFAAIGIAAVVIRRIH